MKQHLQPIFIFSLPRSGSTFVQRILSSHAQISSASEPWLLLPFIYAFRMKGVYTEYWQKVSVQAMGDFVSELPKGKHDYDDALQEFILRLYTGASDEQSVYFLDKTPRYHMIVNEIIALFPNAKFIFVWRNPLSVIASIMKTFAGGRWNLHQYKMDLFAGLPNLIQAYEENKEKSYALQYEDLLHSPVEEMKKVFAYLDLDWSDNLVSTFSDVQLSGSMGDPTGVKEYTEVSKAPLDKWRSVLRNPLRKAWCRRYLKRIGNARWEKIDYNLSEMLSDLDSTRMSTRYLFSDCGSVITGFFFSFISPRLLQENVKLFPALRSMYTHY